MSADKNNIEELFKSTFENFESEVDPTVWQNIQSNISAGTPSSSGLANSAGQTVVKSVVKWAAAVGIGGTVAVGSYFYFSADSESTLVEKQETPQLEEIKVEELPEVKESVQATEIIERQNTVREEVNEKKSSSLSQNQDQTVTDVTPDNSIAKSLPVQNNEVVEEVNNEASTPVEKVVTTDHSTDNKEEPSATREPEKVSLPIAKISASSTKGKLPLEVSFENVGSTGHCSWFIKGTGIQMESNSVEHIFERAGEYWVILAVEDKNNQLAMDSVKITVEADYHIACPNLLTPNGDGSNDIWEISSKNVSQMRWYIMNRAGQKVFEWDSLDGFWDGRDMKGNQVPPGAYLYIIEGKTSTGDPIVPEKGVINVFR